MKISNNTIALIVIIFMLVSVLNTWLVFEKTKQFSPITGSTYGSSSSQVSLCVNRAPVLDPIGDHNTTEGVTFVFDVNATDPDENNVLTFHDNTSLFDIDSSTGMINFTPPDYYDDRDVGKHSILIWVDDGAGCTNSIDGEVITFTIFAADYRPNITSYYPKNLSFNISEEASQIFNISFYDQDIRNNQTTDNLTVRWYLNSTLLKEEVVLYNTTDLVSKSNYTYVADYTSAGSYNVTVKLNDSRYVVQLSWLMNVTNVNRDPYFDTLPNQTWLEDTSIVAFDLDDYSHDPDVDDIINYTYSHIEQAHSIVVEIDPATHWVSLSQPPNWYGVEHIYFTVYDNHNGSANSNNITLTVIDVPEPTMEPGEIAPAARAGGGGGGGAYICQEEWYCSAWSLCTPEGKQTRKCYDLNNCGTNKSKPPEERECVYIGQCFNGIQDQNEEGIDCGGPCKPCGTCFDGIKNQGEEGIDCGGPCKPCPSCFDGIKNQGEEGIDCGGPCKPCPVIEEKPAYVEKPVAPEKVSRTIFVFISLFVLLIITTAYLGYRYIWPLVIEKIQEMPWIVAEKQRREFERITKEKEEIRRSVQSGLRKAERILIGGELDKSSREFSISMREFFKNLFGMEYEFTYEELLNEINQRKLEPSVKEILLSYIKKLSDIEYSAYKPTKDELQALIEEAREIVALIVGEAEETKEKMPKKTVKFVKKQARLESLYGIITRTIDEINQGNITKAERLYVKCHNFYKKLPVKDKERVYEQMMRLYEELKLARARRVRKRK